MKYLLTLARAIGSGTASNNAAILWTKMDDTYFLIIDSVMKT